MNHPNTLLIQRKALARFRKKIPFLALIPPAIYRRLSPLEWYEAFGEIEQARRELEEKLNCYVMLYKRYRPLIPWEQQLFVYINHADLTSEQRGILHAANEAFLKLGIEAEAYQKPLRLRTAPLENPLDYCSPPDEDEEQGLAGVSSDEDIPF
jgi:hypothetical protein